MEICNRLYGEVWPFQHCSMYGSGAWVKKENGKARGCGCVCGWFGTGTQETSKGLVSTGFLLKTSSLQMLMGRIVCHLHTIFFQDVSGNFGSETLKWKQGKWNDKLCRCEHILTPNTSSIEVQSWSIGFRHQWSTSYPNGKLLQISYYPTGENKGKVPGKLKLRTSELELEVVPGANASLAVSRGSWWTLTALNDHHNLCSGAFLCLLEASLPVLSERQKRAKNRKQARIPFSPRIEWFLNN